MESPRLSVVVPTRNRARMLGETLESFTRQSLAPDAFEVLVVDNGSTDETPAVCERYAARLPRLRRRYDPRPGLHVGRHLGLRESTSAVLVYADDDIQALPDWLATIERTFRDPAVALVGGNDLPWFDGPVPPWFERLWQRCPYGRTIGPLSLIDFGDQPRDVAPHYVYGCNFAIRKSVLLELGGFHPDGMPRELLRFRGDGETHVSEALAARGVPARFEPGASVRHAVPVGRLNARYFRERAFAQGISASYTRMRRRGEASWSGFLGDLPTAARGLLGAVRQNLRRTGPPFLLHQWLGHWQGRWAHFRWCRRDPDVLSWVRQSVYHEEPGMTVPGWRAPNAAPR